jgi:hypothetical protein
VSIATAAERSRLQSWMRFQDAYRRWTDDATDELAISVEEYMLAWRAVVRAFGKTAAVERFFVWVRTLPPELQSDVTPDGD